MSHRAHNWSKLQKAGGPGRKGLLLLIADMCDENLECFPSIGLLAQIMETSERYIRGMLQDLEDAKLIASEFRYRNGRRTSSKYRVLVPEGFVEVSVSAHYRNHSSATTGTMVPKLPEPEFLAEPPVEPPFEPSAVAQAPDKSEAPSKAPAFAEVRAGAPTQNMGSPKKGSAKIPKQRQAWPSNEKRDNDWRAQIVAADVDELDDVLSTNGHGKSAYRMSSFRLGLGTCGSVPDELHPQYIRHAYLYLLKDVAETDPEHLDELKYPLDESVEAGPAPHKWDHTEHVPAGETAASFSARMLQVTASMPPEQLGPWAAEIEDFLPSLWYQKRHKAREQVRAQGLPLEIETIASAAVRLMIQYYTDKAQPKWPAEVVPPLMRTVTSITESPSWAA